MAEKLIPLGFLSVRGIGITLRSSRNDNHCGKPAGNSAKPARNGRQPGPAGRGRDPAAQRNRRRRRRQDTTAAEPRAVDDQIEIWDWGNRKRQAADAPAFGERGRRRTRQDQISRWAGRPGEIAELEEIRTERRKPVSSAGPVSDRAPELFESSIQPFDLMSRRHPLSSTRAAYLKSASRSKPSWRLV